MKINKIAMVSLLSSAIAIGVAISTVGDSIISDIKFKKESVKIERTIEDKIDYYTSIDQDFVKRLEGIQDKNGNQVFSLEKIHELWDHKEEFSMDNIDYLEKVVEACDKDPKIFNEEDLSYFCFHGIDIDHIHELSHIKDESGIPVFDGSDVALLSHYKTPIDFIRSLVQLSLEKRKQAFDSTLIRFLYLASAPLDHLEQIMDIKGENGIPRFNYSEIRNLISSKASLKFIKDLSDIKDKTGTYEFTGFQISRLFQLNLSKKEILKFKDTDKPNALLVYPAIDPINEFYSPIEISILEALKKKYDTRIIVASKEEEVYKELENIPNIMFFNPKGHGEYNILALGEYQWGLQGVEDGDVDLKTENYGIDTSDNELEKVINNLHPNAVIFLDSCSNGEGRERKANLANFIKKLSKGRKVISATEPYSGEDMEIQNFYPFDVKIVKDGRDITYNL